MEPQPKHINQQLLMTEQKPKTRQRDHSESFFEKLSENPSDLIVPTINLRDADVEKFVETEQNPFQSPIFLGDPFKDLNNQHFVFPSNVGLADSQNSNPDADVKEDNLEPKKDSKDNQNKSKHRKKKD